MYYYTRTDYYTEQASVSVGLWTWLKKEGVTTMRDDYIAIKKAKMQNNDNTKRSQQQLSFIADGNTKSYSSFGDSLEISYKTKYNLSYTPAIIIPVIYPKELEIYIHIICLLHTCTFLSTLFITAKTWKQPRWP
jgi:hypothetical protein